ncbi:MAG: hypothetical protein K0R97_3293, partial [Oerskovia sp.]|nr:hypothetical protein [Oerskovia sp.]
MRDPSGENVTMSGSAPTRTAPRIAFAGAAPGVVTGAAASKRTSQPSSVVVPDSTAATARPSGRIATEFTTASAATTEPSAEAVPPTASSNRRVGAEGSWASRTSTFPDWALTTNRRFEVAWNATISAADSS